MTDVVVQTDPGPEFAAGVAAATAAQAADDAAEAGAAAQLAEAVASDAAQMAGNAQAAAAEAELTALVVNDRVDALTEIVMTGFAAVSQALADVEDEVDEVEEVVDAAAEQGAPPLTSETTPEPDDKPEPAPRRTHRDRRRTAFGNSPFFRGRG